MEHGGIGSNQDAHILLWDRLRCWLMNAANKAAPTPPGTAEKMMETTPSSFFSPDLDLVLMRRTSESRRLLR